MSQADRVQIGPLLVSMPDRSRVTLVGERISEFLAVSPAVTRDGKLAGVWVVTHIPSGARLSPEGVCVEHARAAARAFADVDVDWARSYESLSSDEPFKRAALAVWLRTGGRCHCTASCAGVGDG